MTSSPSSDAPVFRGKSLTPESPRPVHIPEPASIPVLENQIDPIFNLTSTHLRAAPPLAAATAAAGMDTEPARAASASDDPPRPANESERGEGEQDPRLGEAGQETAEPSMKGGVPQQDQSESLPTSRVPDAPAASPHAATAPPPLAAAAALDTAVPDPLNAPSPLLRELTSAAELPPTQPDPLHASEAGEGVAAEAPVNYQALIDNIIPSNSAEGPREVETAADALRSENGEAPAYDNTSNPSSPSLAVPAASLPPRPPPQEKPSIHPNYSFEEDIRSFHFPNHAQPTSIPSNGAYPGAQPFQTAGPAPGTNSHTIPPAPGTSYPTMAPTSDMQDRESYQAQTQRVRNETARRQNAGDRNDNAPWGPEIQKLYDKFLEDEAVYTAEGTWDRFPKDSRLFVGNLPSDVVTKRDIFHIFYRYGLLAQISIKNAYGFVQFMDESACRSAMHAEQGKKIKEKSMHLEISKPPKNSRNAAVSAAGERLRASHYRRSRSRSPDHDRRPGSRGDRFNRGSGDYRDAFRRGRDDYRPGRSPSPHGRGGREGYRGRDRSPDRYAGGRRDRSRSPYGRYRNRSPSPPRRMYGEDDGVPLPRRTPRDVPEVQIILIDQLDRGFVDFVQNAFRARTLSVAVLPMPNQISLDAVVKRQIVEGVMAIVKLHRGTQISAKIPVQIFDRTGGLNQVRYEEYEGLEPHVAAELVIRSKQKQATAALNAQPPYGTALQQLGISIPPSHQPQPQQQNTGQPNLANLITQLDGPALQKLLGAMQNPQTPQSAQSMPQPSPTQTMGFGNVMGGMPPQQGTQGAGPGYAYHPQVGPGGHQGQAPFAAYQGQPQGQPPQQQPQPQQQQQPYGYPSNAPPPNQVQDIMSQLAQWRR